MKQSFLALFPLLLHCHCCTHYPCFPGLHNWTGRRCRSRVLFLIRTVLYFPFTRSFLRNREDEHVFAIPPPPCHAPLFFQQDLPIANLSRAMSPSHSQRVPLTAPGSLAQSPLLPFVPLPNLVSPSHLGCPSRRPCVCTQAFAPITPEEPCPYSFPPCAPLVAVGSRGLHIIVLALWCGHSPAPGPVHRGESAARQDLRRRPCVCNGFTDSV